MTVRIPAKKCRSCGWMNLKTRHRCISCGSDDMEEATFAGTGKLYTFSTVYVPAAMMLGKEPYTVAVVELDEGQKITGRMADHDEDRFQLGMKVKAVAEEDGIYIFDRAE